ncbi:MFS transporter [Desulfallas thermosapovorans]|uniref:Putative MFS family arabinose efflux permease n=1 Tax=Desulfallas thermosapovorans DSM 6562 TaxID=1121431 RepID=A0A5S4ZXP7_9FIRM|nr:MFS transporter [Desulfallas thermosapovorans]TYO96907.1 putative MFS family arabinose efflux permease [Desulfallas thermosapovorans DSM 6562]
MHAIEEHSTNALWTRDFVIIFLVNLFIFVSFQMLLPTLPVYAKHLGGQETAMGMIIGVFTVSALLVRPFVGQVLDSSGRRGPLLLGLAVFMLSVLAYNWAFSIIALLAFRFLHGFGWGIISTAAGTVATDLIPRKRLGEGMGYFGLTSTISMAIAPVIGLYILNRAGFPTLFYISTILSFIALVLAVLIRYPRVENKGQSGRGVKALIEPKAIRPSVSLLLVATTYGAVVSFIAIYAGQQGITNIGIFFTVYALALTVTRPLSGILADRRGFDVAVLPGMVLIIAAMLVLSQAQQLWMFLLAGVLYGVGFGGMMPSLQALAVKDVIPARRGAANSTFFSAFDLGIGLGAVMWGAVAQATSYAVMYQLSAIPGVLALISYLVLKDKAKKERATCSNNRV